MALGTPRAVGRASVDVAAPEGRPLTGHPTAAGTVVPQPGWRNRQTRRPQKPLLERVCGFKSHSGHAVTVVGCRTHAPLDFHDDVVALFPGQGSISQRRRRPTGTSSRHWEILDARQRRRLGSTWPTLLLTAPTTTVVRTDHAQIATFALSMVGYRRAPRPGGAARGTTSATASASSPRWSPPALSTSRTARGSSACAARRWRAPRRATEGSMVALMGGDEGAREGLDERRRRLGRQRQRPGPDRRQRHARRPRRAARAPPRARLAARDAARRRRRLPHAP